MSPCSHMHLWCDAQTQGKLNLCLHIQRQHWEHPVISKLFSHYHSRLGMLVYSNCKLIWCQCSKLASTCQYTIPELIFVPEVHDADHSPPSSARVMNELELYILPPPPPWCLHRCVVGLLYLLLKNIYYTNLSFSLFLTVYLSLFHLYESYQHF
jgi:hypothetical protein